MQLLLSDSTHHLVVQTCTARLNTRASLKASWLLVKCTHRTWLNSLLNNLHLMFCVEDKLLYILSLPVKTETWVAGNTGKDIQKIVVQVDQPSFIMECWLLPFLTLIKASTNAYFSACSAFIHAIARTNRFYLCCALTSLHSATTEDLIHEFVGCLYICRFLTHAGRGGAGPTLCLKSPIR